MISRVLDLLVDIARGVEDARALRPQTGEGDDEIDLLDTAEDVVHQPGLDVPDLVVRCVREHREHAEVFLEAGERELHAPGDVAREARDAVLVEDHRDAADALRGEVVGERGAGVGGARRERLGHALDEDLEVLPRDVLLDVEGQEALPPEVLDELRDEGLGDTFAQDVAEELDAALAVVAGDVLILGARLRTADLK